MPGTDGVPVVHLNREQVNRPGLHDQDVVGRQHQVHVAVGEEHRLGRRRESHGPIVGGDDGVVGVHALCSVLVVDSLWTSW